MFVSPFEASFRPAEEKSGGEDQGHLDECIEVPTGTSANCYAHCLEELTPSDHYSAEAQSQRDTYASRNYSYAPINACRVLPTASTTAPSVGGTSAKAESE
jgi:hypothetical protein